MSEDVTPQAAPSGDRGDWFDEPAASAPATEPNPAPEPPEATEPTEATPAAGAPAADARLTALETRLQEREAQLMRLAGAYQQLSSTQAQGPTMNPSPSAPTEPTLSAEEELVRQQLGDDEAGRKAYDTLEKFFASKTKNQPDPQALLQQVDAVVSKRLGGFESSMLATNQLQDMVGKGLITSEQSVEMANRVAQAVQQQPAWAESKANMTMLLDHFLATDVKAGKIKPGKPGRATVTQPGGSGGNAPQAAQKRQELEGIKAVAGRMGRLRGLSEEKIAELARRSGANV